MAGISVGDAIGEGFSLIRRRPGAVAIWGGCQLLFMAAAVTVFAPVYAAMLAQISQNAQPGVAASPDMTAMIAHMRAVQGPSLLIDLVGLIVNSVLMCGVFRAVLHPEQSAFGYLRIGAAEGFLVLFSFGFFLVFFLAGLVAAIPLVLINMLLAHGSVAGAALFDFLAIAGLIVGFVYVVLRLSLIGPTLVDQDSFRLGEAWALTRGRVGGLLLLAFLLVVVAWVAESVVFGVFLSVLSASVGGFTPLATLIQQPPAVMLSRLGPVFVVMGVVWVIFIACFLPIFMAPWARVYRDLTRPGLLSD